MKYIHSVGDEWIEKGFYCYHIGCEKKGCSVEGRIMLLGRVRAPYYKHKFDWFPGCQVPIEYTHSVAWKEEDFDMKSAPFTHHPSA